MSLRVWFRVANGSASVTTDSIVAALRREGVETLSTHCVPASTPSAPPVVFIAVAPEAAAVVQSLWLATGDAASAAAAGDDAAASEASSDFCDIGDLQSPVRRAPQQNSSPNTSSNACSFEPVDVAALLFERDAAVAAATAHLTREVDALRGRNAAVSELLEQQSAVRAEREHALVRDATLRAADEVSALRLQVSTLREENLRNADDRNRLEAELASCRQQLRDCAAAAAAASATAKTAVAAAAMTIATQAAAATTAPPGYRTRQGTTVCFTPQQGGGAAANPNGRHTAADTAAAASSYASPPPPYAMAHDYAVGCVPIVVPKRHL